MVRGLNSTTDGELQWMGEFSKGCLYPAYMLWFLISSLCLTLDFRRRFLSLLSYKFREFNAVLALSVLEASNSGVKRLNEALLKGVYHSWGS